MYIAYLIGQRVSKLFGQTNFFLAELVKKLRTFCNVIIEAADEGSKIVDRMFLAKKLQKAEQGLRNA